MGRQLGPERDLYFINFMKEELEMKKSMLSVIAALAGAVVGAGVLGYRKIKQHEEDFKVIKKNEAILKMFSQWILNKQEGRSIAGYLKEKGYNKIAIYGMSSAGERLLDDLKQTDIEIAYGIDQNADRIFSEVEVVSPDGNLEPVDAVIVTAIYNFDEIEEKLSDLIDCPIISLEDVIYEI